MEKREVIGRKNIFIVFLICFLLILGIYFFALNFTANLIRNIDLTQNYNFNEDLEANYGVLINNTGSVASQNMSRVDIILPDSFVFSNDSNITDVINSLFVKQGNNLSWSGDNLIPNLSSRFFSFKATAPTPGDYNLSVYAINSTGFEFQNLTIRINDTSSPNGLYFVSPSDENNSAISRDYIKYNISAQDNVAVHTISVFLYNSSMILNKSSSSQTNPFSSNFSNLSEGIYYLNFSVNDTSSNINSSSELRKITVDLTAPIITLISPNISQVINTSYYYFKFNVNSLADIDYCELIFDEEIIETEYEIDKSTTNRISEFLTNGANNWTINCTDAAGNEGTSGKRAFIVDIPPSANASSDLTASQNSNSTNTSFNNTTIIQVSETQIKNAYENSNLSENTEIKIKVANQSHSIKIGSITNSSVVLTIYSSPKQASFSVGEEKKFELTEDNYNDLKIKLNSISSNKANITLKEIHELIINGTTQRANDQGNFNRKKSIIIFALIGGGILLFIIGIIFLVKKYKKNKEDNSENKQDNSTSFQPPSPIDLPPMLPQILPNTNYPG